MIQTVRKLEVVKNYNQQTVDLLEQLLDEAKRGEIVEILVVSKCLGGEYDNSWTGCKDLHQLVGELERIKYLTLKRMDI